MVIHNQLIFKHEYWKYIIILIINIDVPLNMYQPLNFLPRDFNVELVMRLLAKKSPAEEFSWLLRRSNIKRQEFDPNDSQKVENVSLHNPRLFHSRDSLQKEK